MFEPEGAQKDRTICHGWQMIFARDSELLEGGSYLFSRRIQAMSPYDLTHAGWKIYLDLYVSMVNPIVQEYFTVPEDLLEQLQRRREADNWRQVARLGRPVHERLGRL